jgi:hypothetical protein
MTTESLFRFTKHNISLKGKLKEYTRTYNEFLVKPQKYNTIFNPFLSTVGFFICWLRLQIRLIFR